MATDSATWVDPDPPEIVLRVDSRWGAGGRMRLVYKLHVAGRVATSRYETVAFASGERDLLSLRDTLRSLRAGCSPRTATRRLLGVARELTERLVPRPVRERLAATVASAGSRAVCMLIVTEASWLPFEMLLVEPGDLFWCQAFAICRWLPHLAPSRALPMRRLAMVSAVGRDLPDLARERRLVREGRNESDVVDLIRQDDVLQALDDGAYEIFHFAGHAEVAVGQPDMWKLAIGPGLVITAADVNGLAPGFRGQRPWIFLNVCSSTRGGESWGRAGGMAATFVHAGARAVIGASWPVTDVLATEFAAATYSCLHSGMPLGEAVRQARQSVHGLAPDDPTWLAYAVYGHPGARKQDQPATESIGPDEAGSPDGAFSVRLPAPGDLDETPDSAAAWPVRGLGRKPIGVVIGIVLAVVVTLAAATKIGVLTRAAEPSPGDSPPSVGVDAALSRASGEHGDSTPAAAPESAPSIDEEPAERTRHPPMPFAIEVPEGKEVRVEMIPALLAVRFDQEEGIALFVVTVHLGDGPPVEGTFAERGNWKPFIVETASGRWQIAVTGIDKLQKQVSVAITGGSR